ncbi:MAG: hypothetical protein RLZZ127_1542 [Planctomycetota bacterium]|jgi:hypothetical protein
MRPDDQASWRVKTKPEPVAARAEGPCGFAPDGLPVKEAMRVTRWLTAGPREGAVRGLGTSAARSGGLATAADGRGAVVPMTC